MHRSMSPVACLATALALQAPTAAVAQSNKPQGGFEESTIEVPRRATPKTLYDVLATGDVSPLGTPASSVEPEQVLANAQTYLRGGEGRPKNLQEAAFWLRRAITATDPNIRKAIEALALLYANGGEGVGEDRDAARRLWEIAGAMGSATALYNLGYLAESGGKGGKPDKKTALVWYERAQKAGFERAAAAIERLSR